MAGKFILIYNGLGSSPQSLKMLTKCLQEATKKSSYHIRHITPDEILHGNWQDKAALLSIGGGFDKGFIESLGTEGMMTIRQYVENGGSYLGICAGGYFGCSSIQFDKGGSLEICGSRELHFFPGPCIGPVFPGFKYNSEQGAHAVAVKYITDEKSTLSTPIDCYFNGGGYFDIKRMENNQSSDPKDRETAPGTCDILSVYNDLPGNPAAIVKCTVKKGVAVLSGVHFEYNSNDLDADNEFLGTVISRLQRSDDRRELLVKTILRNLRLCDL